VVCTGLPDTAKANRNVDKAYEALNLANIT